MLTVVVEVLRPLEESLEAYGISEVIVAIGLLLILLYRPRGLFGTQEPAIVVRQRVSSEVGRVLT